MTLFQVSNVTFTRFFSWTRRRRPLNTWLQHTLRYTNLVVAYVWRIGPKLACLKWLSKLFLSILKLFFFLSLSYDWFDFTSNGPFTCNFLREIHEPGEIESTLEHSIDIFERLDKSFHAPRSYVSFIRLFSQIVNTKKNLISRQKLRIQVKRIPLHNILEKYSGFLPLYAGWRW